MIYFLALVYIAILLLELPALVRNRWWKEIAVFSVFFIISIYLGLAQFYYWPLFNPFTAASHLSPIRFK